MKIIYIKHAEEKLKLEVFVWGLKINKSIIKKAIDKPDLVIKEGDDEKVRAVKEVDLEHSLVVIYKYVGTELKVITFFPARKGRYETKILSRRRYLGN